MYDANKNLSKIPRRNAIAIFGKGFVSLAAAETLIGCGSGNSTVIAGRGAVILSIKWPNSARAITGRLVPAATQSIQVTLTRSGTQLATPQTVTPPSAGNVSTITFPDVPIGTVTLTANAFPTTNGTGTALASAMSVIQVQQGQSASVTVVMTSNVQNISVLAEKPSLAPGEYEILIATATDASGNAILIAPSSWAWSSSNPAVATVQSPGTDNTSRVTALAIGSATITATYTEPVPQVSGGVTISVGTTSTGSSATGSTTVGNTPSAVAVNLAANRVYVANNADNTVTVIDGTNLTPIATVQVGVSPVSLCVNNSSGTVYVLNNGGGTPAYWTMTVLDGNTYKTLATVYNLSGSTDGSGGCLTINPVTGTVYATTGSNVIYGIDHNTNQIADVFSVPSSYRSPGLQHIALNTNTGAIYAGSNQLVGSGSFYAFNNSGQLEATLAQVNCTALAVSSVNNVIYSGTGDFGFGSPQAIAVISGATNTQTERYNIASSYLAFNDTKNELIVVQSSFGSSSLLVVDVASAKIIQTVSLSQLAAAVAVNTVTGIIYITQRSNTLTAIQS